MAMVCLVTSRNVTALDTFSMTVRGLLTRRMYDLGHYDKWLPSDVTVLKPSSVQEEGRRLKISTL